MENREKDKFVWVSYSDLATGLMMCFILIFLYSLNGLRAETQKLKGLESEVGNLLGAREEVVEILKETREIMNRNFRNRCQGVENWIVDEEKVALRVKFRSVDPWFLQNSHRLQRSAQECLQAFGPSFFKRIYDREDLLEYIEQVIVEGHASSEGGYLRNLNLSQSRAFEVAEYFHHFLDQRQFSADSRVYTDWAGFENWRRKRIAANGRSSAEPILVNGIEDREASRRVEFRVVVAPRYDQLERTR